MVRQRRPLPQPDWLALPGPVRWALELGLGGGQPVHLTWLSTAGQRRQTAGTLDLRLDPGRVAVRGAHGQVVADVTLGQIEQVAALNPEPVEPGAR